MKNLLFAAWKNSSRPKIGQFELVNMVLVPGNFVKCYFDLAWHRECALIEKEGFTMVEEGKFSLRDSGRS